MGKAKGQEHVTRPRASMVKLPAPEERSDVSALLGRLAEQHLKARIGGRQ